MLTASLHRPATILQAHQLNRASPDWSSSSSRLFRGSGRRVVDDLVFERLHVDPEFAAGVEGKAGVETLSIFGYLAQDGVLRPGVLYSCGRI